MAEKCIPIPDSITEASGIRGQGLSRSWRLPLWKFLLFTCLCIAVNTFLVFMYRVIPTIQELGWWRLAFMLFLLVHVWCGLYMAYFLICTTVNSTHIMADAQSLHIHHGPLPWKGNKVVPLSEIAQLYVTEAQSTDSYGNITLEYEVNMLDHQHQVRKLMKGLESAAEALYIQKYMTERLALKVEPVPGAYEG